MLVCELLSDFVCCLCVCVRLKMCVLVVMFVLMVYGCVWLYVCVCVCVCCLSLHVWCVCDLLRAAFFVLFSCGGVVVSFLCVLFCVIVYDLFI